MLPFHYIENISNNVISPHRRSSIFYLMHQNELESGSAEKRKLEITLTSNILNFNTAYDRRTCTQKAFEIVAFHVMTLRHRTKPTSINMLSSGSGNVASVSREMSTFPLNDLSSVSH